MATNAVIQTVGAAGYVSLRVTQASHGLTGRVPVYYNTSTNLWTAAQANAGTTLGTHLAKVIDSNTLLIVQSGIFPDTSHGLTAGQYYFVSDSAAGTLTVTEPTAVGSFSNPMIYVTDANTYIVLGYRSSQTVNQSFNPLLNDGTAAAPSLAFSADTDTGLYRIGANDLGVTAGGVKVAEFDSNGITANVPYACFVDEKAAGTDGGSFSSGDWRTRVLNTTRGTNSITGSSLSSNQFILPSGTYRISASAPAYYVNGHIAKLRNITDSLDTIIGTCEFTTTGATGDDTNKSFINGIFTINSQKTFEIQHRCFTTNSSSGFGRGINFSVVNIYTVVEIWKLS